MPRHSHPRWEVRVGGVTAVALAALAVLAARADGWAAWLAILPAAGCAATIYRLGVAARRPAWVLFSHFDAAGSTPPWVWVHGVYPDRPPIALVDAFLAAPRKDVHGNVTPRVTGTPGYVTTRAERMILGAELR